MDTVREMEDKLKVNANASTLILKLDVPHSLIYLLSGERFETKVRKDLPSRAFAFHDHLLENFCILSSCNGILCLLYGGNGCNKVLLSNPSTREFKVIPPSLVEFESPFRVPSMHYKGFGYDPLADDYKVIRFTKFRLPWGGPFLKNVSIEPLWEVYSLRSDSWKTLNSNLKMIATSYSFQGGLYTDSHLYDKGVSYCHWLDEIYYHPMTDIVRVFGLVSFDLSKEVLSFTPKPSYMYDADYSLSCYPMYMQLGVINRCVALIYICEDTTIEVSILREVGVKESWTKLFIIGLPICGWNLVGVGRNGRIFVQNDDDKEVAWFECGTLPWDCPGPGIAWLVGLGVTLPNCQIVTYKENFETLISLGFEKYD